MICYADDILLLAKNVCVTEKLLEISTAYLERKLRCKINTQKSWVINVYSIRFFSFPFLRWKRTERSICPS